MSLIIDTMNVLHVTGVLPPELAGLDIGDLAELIRLSRHRDQLAILVCDGAGPAKNPIGTGVKDAGFQVRFAGKGRTADDVIAQLVNRSTTPRRVTVVSSDNAVLRAARRRRCSVLSSEQFLQQLVTDVRKSAGKRRSPARKPPSPTMTETQIARWESIFNVDVEALARSVERDHRLAPADISATPARRIKSEPVNKQAGAKTRRLDARTRAKRGHPNRQAQTNDREPPKPVLPRNLVEEAEQMVQAFDSSRPPSNRRSRRG